MYSLNLICTNRFEWAAHLGGSRSSDLYLHIHMEWSISVIFVNDSICRLQNQRQWRATTMICSAVMRQIGSMHTRTRTRTRTHSSSLYCRVHKAIKIAFVCVFLLSLFKFIVMHVLSVIKGKWTEFVCTIYACLICASDRQRRYEHELTKVKIRIFCMFCATLIQLKCLLEVLLLFIWVKVVSLCFVLFLELIFMIYARVCRLGSDCKHALLKQHAHLVRISPLIST